MVRRDPLSRFRLPRLYRTLQGRLTSLFVLAATVLVAAGSVLLLTVQSRNDDALLTKTLRTRIDRIVADVGSTGALPDTEVYAQIITAFRSVRDLTPALAKEYLLTNEQLDFVFRSGQLQIDRRLPSLPGTGRLLAQRRSINGTPVVIVVGASRELERLTRQRLLLTLAIAGPFIVAILGFAGWLLTGAALRPVKRLADEASDISRADTGRRLALPRGSDEIRHLGQTLNDMLDRLATSFAREKSFVDDASHELRTPLAILRGELELATLQIHNNDYTMRALYSAIEEVDRLSALADQLLVLARANSNSDPATGSCILMDVLPAIVERLRTALPTDISVEWRGGCDGAVSLANEQLAQIITNLVTNGLRFARSRLCIDVQSVVSEPPVTVKPGRAVLISVHDDGPGFDPSILPTAFERFTIADRARTRRASTGGAGLGLAIVRSLAEMTGGSARALQSNHLGGGLVEVTLPLRYGPGHPDTSAERATELDNAAQDHLV